MTWIKTWSLIDPEKVYLVVATTVFEKSSPWVDLLKGKYVKEIREGTYIATELVLPKSLEDCR